jgi:hypothetical protein
VIELFNTVGVNSKVTISATPLPRNLLEPLEPAPAKAPGPEQELARKPDRAILLSNAENATEFPARPPRQDMTR